MTPSDAIVALLAAGWFVPLIGGVALAMLLWIPKVSPAVVSWTCVGVLAVCFAMDAAAAWSVLPADGVEGGLLAEIGTPLRLGGFEFRIGLLADNLSAVMAVTVSLIATCVAVFARGYLRDEGEPHYEEAPLDEDTPGEMRPGRLRTFYATLLFFVGCMKGLILSDNLFQTFVFWELVGVCSFLLIGFYRERPLAGPAAVKAFVVNRIGDAGFLIGIMILWDSLGTLSFNELPYRVDNARFIAPSLLTAAALGIFAGCVGKSAQVPLQTWLPDAMAGPTPVSALVHSATMVAAGVYLVARAYPVFTPDALLIVAYTGAATLTLGGLFALAADDFKRILAWSTVSQLGYMMLSLGVGGPEAAVFHLVTHAFFKSLLFLAAGVVIHSTHVTRISEMGGLWRRMPWACGLTAVGCVAITGLAVPGVSVFGEAIALSGYHSKDAILAEALDFVRAEPKHGLLFVLPLLTAGLTALYMGRLFFRVFLGAPRTAGAENAHRAEGVMVAPMTVLAVLASVVAVGGQSGALWNAIDRHEFVVAGNLRVPTAAAAETSVRDSDALSAGGVPHSESADYSHEDHTAGTLALIAAFLGLGVAYLLYARGNVSTTRLRGMFPGVTEWLKSAGRFDEVYTAAAVDPAKKTGRGLSLLDGRLIDGFVHGLASRCVSLARAEQAFDRRFVDGAVNGVASLTEAAGGRLRRLQTGSVRTYVLYLGAGLLSAFAVVFTFLAA